MHEPGERQGVPLLSHRTAHIFLQNFDLTDPPTDFVPDTAEILLPPAENPVEYWRRKDLLMQLEKDRVDKLRRLRRGSIREIALHNSLANDKLQEAISRNINAGQADPYQRYWWVATNEFADGMFAVAEAYRIQLGRSLLPAFADLVGARLPMSSNALEIIKNVTKLKGKSDFERVVNEYAIPDDEDGLRLLISHLSEVASPIPFSDNRELGATGMFQVLNRFWSHFDPQVSGDPERV